MRRRLDSERENGQQKIGESNTTEGNGNSKQDSKNGISIDQKREKPWKISVGQRSVAPQPLSVADRSRFWEKGSQKIKK